MHKPNQELFKEHGLISEALIIMGKVANKLKNGNEVKKEDLDRIVEFINNYADKLHHGKEEEVLFPELEKIASNKKIVNELLGEHRVGRDFVQGISESLKGYRAGNPEAYHIAVNLFGYIQLLTVHIRKENTLFSLADKQLSEALWKEMEPRFEKFTAEAMGAGKYEEYQGWLKELKESYL